MSPCMFAVPSTIVLRLVFYGSASPGQDRGIGRMMVSWIPQASGAASRGPFDRRQPGAARLPGHCPGARHARLPGLAAPHVRGAEADDEVPRRPRPAPRCRDPATASSPASAWRRQGQPGLRPPAPLPPHLDRRAGVTAATAGASYPPGCGHLGSGRRAHLSCAGLPGFWGLAGRGLCRCRRCRCPGRWPWQLPAGRAAWPGSGPVRPGAGRFRPGAGAAGR